MKYKIIYKGLDNTNKEKIIEKIKEFYKDKYGLKETAFTKRNGMKFDWKNKVPTREAPGEYVTLTIDWDKYEINISEGYVYRPFTNKELNLFDKLGFELEEDFARVMKQDISDWMDET